MVGGNSIQFKSLILQNEDDDIYLHQMGKWETKSSPKFE